MLDARTAPCPATIRFVHGAKGRVLPARDGGRDFRAFRAAAPLASALPGDGAHALPPPPPRSGRGTADRAARVRA